MAVTIAEITKLRKLSGAGMMDCKKALEESNGDIEKAMEIIRKKGQAVAAKRSDREVKLNQQIIDAAVAAKAKSLDEIKGLMLGNETVADAIIARSGITGEKMELDGYSYIESDNISTYDHQGKHMLCTMVALNKAVDPQYGHAVAMQIAAMNPISINKDDVPEDVRQREFEIAADKARQEGKPEAMIERIAEGRMQKFYKENCLLNQEFIQDGSLSVADYLKKADKDCTVTAFKRFTLRAE